MWQCPTCGKKLDDSVKLCWICGTSADGTPHSGFPWESGWGRAGRPVKAISSWLNGMPKASGVPRRFSLGRLMLITTFFSVLFGLLSWLDAHPVLFVVVVVFVAVVGVAQTILYSGKKPREASIAAGCAIGVLVGVAGSLQMLLSELGRITIGEFVAVVLFNGVMTVLLGVAGGVLGYLAGCLIAGVFLGKRSSLPDADDHRPEIPDPLSTEDTQTGSPEHPPEG